MIDTNKTMFKTAIQFAVNHEIGWSRDTTGVWGVHQNDIAPYNQLYGPIHPRGGVCGVIAQDGKILTTFGDVDRADLTFSVAKAYLALLAGLAFDQGLLTPDQHVAAVLPGIGFDDAHNRLVTWRHLLQQTSEWQGSCFGIADQVDHFRTLAFSPPAEHPKGTQRQLQTPGTYWEYNDVRINQLSLALLHLFKRPLPEVFKTHIAEPCGLSDHWQWVGYDHAWAEIDGQRMASVPGGSHWGAGVSISAQDQYRLAHMLLNNGAANDQRVLSPQWIRAMRTPCPLAPFYGYLVWLNHERRIFSSLSTSAYFAMGAGGHFSLIDPESQLVVIVRWLEPSQVNEFLRLIIESIN
jgi:CubicO group peptidase (beta-lactamase class C family)